MKRVAFAASALMLTPHAALAQQTADGTAQSSAADAALARADTIVVTANRSDSFSGTKTDTPLIEVPQAVTLITDDQFLSQGSINISDTVRYAAGITANAYGRDTRVDGFTVRGVEALQFRDGMRDIFSFYASIASDPYNFSRVEIVRGPASVLFGQGSIGGIVNLVSKTPGFTTAGEASLVYGTQDRKEFLGDVNVALSDTLAVRGVARVRDADTYVDNVPDDRVMFAPSIRWQPTPDTDITLTGLYQEDDTGSTAQFLPVVGTQQPNGANPRLDRFLFVGKPGWDRYDGRLLQGGGVVSQRFGDNLRVNLKARYIDSDLNYFTHYPDSYTNPSNPYLDAARRRIGLYADGSIARLNVFSTDNNAQLKFNTGANVEHLLLAGIDYSWNNVRKQGGFAYETIDIYNIDRAALSGFGGTIPTAANAGSATFFSGSSEDTSQKQLGVYVQDQIRFFDRVSVVLGARRDRVRSYGNGNPAQIDKATTFRAGIIGEIGANISPFFSYTESFLPVAGAGLVPQVGNQYEAGAKWQPDPQTLVTATVFRIKDRNRVVYLPTSVAQTGEVRTKGFELEARRTLPGNYELLVNYGYSKLSASEPFFTFLPKHNASVWGTRTFALGDDASFRLGAGVRYTGKRLSVAPNAENSTGANTLVDALAEVEWQQFRFSVNATNLLGNKFYASCLARGDCFVGAPRNLFGTVTYRFGAGG